MLLPQSGFTELTLHLENSYSFLGTKPIQPAVCEMPLLRHTLILKGSWRVCPPHGELLGSCPALLLKEP